MKPFMDRFKWMRRKKEKKLLLEEAEFTLLLGDEHAAWGNLGSVGVPVMPFPVAPVAPPVVPPVIRNVGGAGANTRVLAGQSPGIIAVGPQPDAMLSISSPDGVDSIVIETNGKMIMEAWDTKEAMVGRDGEAGNRPVGSLGFAAGIAYIMTKGGWVNMGEALEKPLEMTDRRGAILAQKARNAARR